jgi:uncharacterized membrane protein YjjP (DUF1212 family)
MENDHLKSDKALSREAMWLSIFGISVAIGFIAGLISQDWFLASCGLLIGVMCFVRKIMIRRIQRVRLAAKFSAAEPRQLS